MTQIYHCGCSVLVNACYSPNNVSICRSKGPKRMKTNRKRETGWRKWRGGQEGVEPCSLQLAPVTPGHSQNTNLQISLHFHFLLHYSFRFDWLFLPPRSQEGTSLPDQFRPRGPKPQPIPTAAPPPRASSYTCSGLQPSSALLFPLIHRPPPW